MICTFYYTTDGSIPTTQAKEFKDYLVINSSQHIKLAAFIPNGFRGDIYQLNFTKKSFAEAIQNTSTKPGLVCTYYKNFFKNVGLMNGKTPDSTFIADNIIVPATVKAPSFGLQYRGYIDIPADGIYSFYLTCDDGGILKIANEETVNNDGLHSAAEKNGQVALRKGLQPFALDFIEGGGGFTLKLKYSINGSTPAEVPSSWFKN